MFFSAPRSTWFSISATNFTPPTSETLPPNRLFICRASTSSTCSSTSGDTLCMVARRVVTSTCSSCGRDERMGAAMEASMWARSRAMVWGCSFWMKLTSWVGSTSDSRLKPVVRMLYWTFSRISLARRGPMACSRACLA